MALDITHRERFLGPKTSHFRLNSFKYAANVPMKSSGIVDNELFPDSVSFAGYFVTLAAAA